MAVLDGLKIERCKNNHATPKNKTPALTSDAGVSIYYKLNL